VGFLGWVFLGGCTQKNPLGFFGYVRGCLNPGIKIGMGMLVIICSKLEMKLTPERPESTLQIIIININSTH